ncbi:MAG TPA: MarR family transcriptional regulator [Sphingomicrobium sp.]|nr:MarR family transcriptional regulator [Sphingomicrobium sp.]
MARSLSLSGSDFSQKIAAFGEFLGEAGISKPEKLDSDADIPKTVALTDRDLRDATRLFRLLADPELMAKFFPEFLSTPAGTKDRDTLISRARIVLSARRLRDRFFNRDMFGEPAWDILLMLYVSEQTSGRVTMTRLAEWVDVPLTTVVRWVKTLQEEQLVERQAHPTDRRTDFIVLLEKGRKALDSYLGIIPG